MKLLAAPGICILFEDQSSVEYKELVIIWRGYLHLENFVPDVDEITALLRYAPGSTSSLVLNSNYCQRYFPPRKKRHMLMCSFTSI